MGEGNMKDQEPLQCPIEKGEKKVEMVSSCSIVILLAGLVLYRGWGFTQKRSGPQRAARMEVPVQVTPVVSKPLTYSIKVTGRYSAPHAGGSLSQGVRISGTDRMCISVIS